MSKPTDLHSGTISERYVTLARDSCSAPCFLHTVEEETRASTSMPRMVAVLVRSESTSTVFELITLNSVSRHDRSWRTSWNLPKSKYGPTCHVRIKTHSPARIHLSRVFIRSQESRRCSERSALTISSASVRAASVRSRTVVGTEELCLPDRKLIVA